MTRLHPCSFIARTALLPLYLVIVVELVSPLTTTHRNHHTLVVAAFQRHSSKSLSLHVQKVSSHRFGVVPTWSPHRNNIIDTTRMYPSRGGVDSSSHVRRAQQEEQMPLYASKKDDNNSYNEKQRSTKFVPLEAEIVPDNELEISVDPNEEDEVESGGSTGGTASIPNLTTSLIKSIVGSGVLALPAGMASIGDDPMAVLPVAALLIAFTGSLNAFFFVMLGRVCRETGATTFQQAWDRSVGQYASAVTWVVALKTFLSCLAFSIILADSLSSLTSLPRPIALWGITVTAILPLTLLKDLKSLAPFSALGLVGMAVTSSTMIVRWLDGSYQPGGPYALSVPEHLQPEFGVAGGPHWEGIMLACSLATAFMAHYNAPRFHAELSNNTNKRFQTVTLSSYGVAAVLFALVASAGFLTFGGHSQGFILNNYADNDPLIATSRVALASSILLTYPLPFVGLRDGCLDLIRSAGLADNDQSEDSLVIPVTVILLLGVTIAATFLKDLGLVIAVGGGTFSTAVSSVFPAFMLHGINQKKNGAWSTDVTIAWIGMWISVLIGATGVWLALEKAFSSS